MDPPVRRVAPPNSFDGADSMLPDYSRPHGQTSLPVPPGPLDISGGRVPCLRLRKHAVPAIEHVYASADMASTPLTLRELPVRFRATSTVRGVAQIAFRISRFPLFFAEGFHYTVPMFWAGRPKFEEGMQ